MTDRERIERDMIILELRTLSLRIALLRERTGIYGPVYLNGDPIEEIVEGLEMMGCE